MFTTAQHMFGRKQLTTGPKVATRDFRGYFGLLPDRAKMNSKATAAPRTSLISQPEPTCPVMWGHHRRRQS